MKRILVSVLLLGTTAGAVAAADALPPIVEIDEGMFDWTGLYIGVQGGFVSGTVETEDFYCVYNPGDCNDAPEDRYFAGVDLSGFKGGAHIGYDHQFGTFVLGAESDLNLGGGSGDGPYFYYDASEGEDFPGNPDESVEFDVLWEGSTRIKLGFALDRVMPYVTGGIAYAGAELVEHRDWDEFYDFEYSNVNLIGYTIGLGAAYAVTDDIVVRGEARFTDYGTTSAAGVDIASGETHDVEIVGPSQVSLEGGISFKF